MQELPTVKSTPGAETGVATIPSATQGPAASDFFRPLRMSAEANRSTLGVETDSVTPELLMAASSKLLAINRREAESDPKDSMEFQRVYGPADYFAEHILRDGSRVARQLLWKATNKGGLDFMPVGALDQHVSDVFNSSKLANMVDGSSPLELVEAAMKITRVGEGGVGDVQSAPDEMRLVQPSFLGFIDPVRSVESLRVGLDAYLTKHCMKGSDGKLYQWFVNARTGKRELLDSVTAARSVITTPDEMKRTTRNVFALGGRTGVRVVPRDSVDYYLPNMDDAFTTASNLVPGLSSVKELRLLMGCLHPATPVMRLNGSRLLELVPASEIAAGDRLVTSGGEVRRVRTVVTRLPLHGMVRVRTLSGRVALVTPDHRWPVLGEDGKEKLVPTSKLRRGDRLVRMLPASLPCRRSFVQGLQVTAATGLVLGTALRSLERTEDGAARLLVAGRHLEAVTRELERRSAEVSREPDAEWEGAERLTVTGDFARWLLSACLSPDGSRVAPPELLGAEPKVASSALDAYTADLTLVAEDADEGMWLVDIPTPGLRQALAILAGRSGLDSDYRDGACRALRLRPADLTSPTAPDPVASVTPVSGGCPAVIDIDVDDATYALGCGLVTHNSKYPQQAVSIEGREPPLVRGLDAASGKDMQSVIGRYLGALYAPKAGTVRAVRRDRVDMDYDDGTRGSIALYRSFPMNAKGLIESTARVKAGDRLEKGGLIASSNYTDDKGVAAVGTNLRTGWLSWKGGTYEDAIVLSETAARKLTSTTMYQTALDLDRTVQLGRDNYTAWKPSEFSAEQLAALDRDGVVRPGTVLRKGDPMVLAVRVTQPSPGTMGRRVLDDLSETWQHDHPGVVTDVLRTRKGVKVLATVTAPLEVGDKISGSHGNKGIVSMVLPDDQMPRDASGQPLEVILSPLGLVSRCYHPDTELRTQDGWKAISDVRDDDLVAQLDPLTLIEALVPQTAPMHSAPFEGELIGYDDGEVSFLVTPRHTIPVFSMDGGASAITAEKASGTDLLVVVAGADSPDAPEPGLPVTRHLRADAWRRVPYAGPVICPSVPSGVVATRLGGHRVCLGNTNPAQLHETLLGKVARRTGKFEVLPAFPDGNVREHVLKRLKEAGLKADDDFFDPEDGRRIPNVVNGYTYFYKLKHLAESKLSARGTDEYSSDETPGGSGYEGCFPAAQEVITAHGPMSIAHICENRLPVAVLTWDDQAGWCYRQVTDWFARHADVGEILDITTEEPSDDGGDPRVTHMLPTRNHVLYRADMTRVAAGDVRPGDLLASHSPDADGVVPVRVRSVKPYRHDNPKYTSVMVYDMTVDGTHRYALSGGNLVSNSKRLGSLEVSALAGHAAFDVLADAKLIRGQRNSEFWRGIRTGGIPTMPGEPLVQRKFFAHLQGSGVNVRKTPKGISVFALSDDDVRQMAGPRELRSRDTYEARTFRPLDGGLFGQDVFGPNGDRWAYIQLDEPLPNPVMADPLARLLRLSDRDFEAVCTGSKEVDGMASSEDVRKRLAGIDLEKESAAALDELRDATKSRRPAALKRYLAVERMRRQGVPPDQYMLTRLPVLPPVYRPISSHAGVTMVADANYLYAQMLDARDDLRAASALPAEYRADARRNLWRSWQELTGMYDPEDVKLRSKNVGGLLQWALGKGSPKFSAFSRKVLGTSVDTVGRGVIQPDARLTIDEIGMPADMAFDTMAPFVTRALVKRGYTPVAAMGMVKDRHPQALDALKEVMATHPVLLNRAPTLHKYSIMAFRPVLVPGKTLHIHPSVCPGLAADFDGDAQSGRVLISVDNEQLAKLVRENKISRADLNFWLRLVQYKGRAGTGPAHNQPEEHNSMAFKSLSVPVASDGAVISMDLADVPHGGLIKTGCGERGNMDMYEALPGVRVLSYDERRGSLVWAEMSGWSEHRGCQVEIVRLANGEEIVTDDDPRAVYGIPLDSPDLTPERFTPTEALRRKVLVPCMAHGAEPSGGLEPGRVDWRTGELLPADADRGLPLDFRTGQCLGMLIGDGWWDKREHSYMERFGGASGIHLSDLEGFNAEYLAEWLGGFMRFARYRQEFRAADLPGRFGDAVRHSFVGDDTAAFGAWLSSVLGGDGDEWSAGSANKHLPPWFWCAPAEFRRGLVCGLVATDGSVSVSRAKRRPQLMIGFASTSLRLCRELRQLARSLGVHVSITFSKVTSRGNDFWQCTVSTVDAKRVGLLEGLCHDRKLRTYLETEVVDNANTRRGTYVAMPAGVHAVLRKWVKAPKLAKVPADSPEYRAKREMFNLYLRLHDAKSTGLLTRAAAAEICRLVDSGELRGLGDSPLFVQWRAMVEDGAVEWTSVESVERTGKEETLYDLSVPGYETFVADNGVVLSNTVNVHVPVSDAARRQAWDRMRPSRNLLGLADHGIMNKPEKEYMQGLYIASRMREGERPRDFRSLKEAQEAYRRGEIEVDTPIRLLDR